MTTNYHTPIQTGAPADAAIFNAPMGQLDQAVGETNADFAALELRMSRIKNGHIIQNNGVTLTQRTTMNFVGGLLAEDIASPAQTRISFQAGWMTFPGTTWDVEDELDLFTIVCTDSDLADPDEGDYTDRLGPGTKVKLTQGATVKYFVVKTAVFELLRTKLTFFENTDYELTYGTAITSPYYAYEAAMPDWPDWFDYDATVYGETGSAGTFAETGKIARFSVHGRTIKAKVHTTITNVGSWAGELRVKLPVTIGAHDNFRGYRIGVFDDNYTESRADLVSGNDYVLFGYPDPAEWSGWVNPVIDFQAELEF